METSEGLFAILDTARARGRAGEFEDARHQFHVVAKRAIDSLLAGGPTRVSTSEDLLRVARAALEASDALQFEIETWPKSNEVCSVESDATNPPHMKSIFGFWHIATLGDWQEVVAEQLSKLRNSGLYDKTETIFVGVVGTLSEYVEFDDPKIRIAFRTVDLTEYEYPTLQYLWEFCREHDGLVYYIHTKGVSDQRPQVIAWRRYLEHFVIERHADCLQALERFDLAGVNWQNLPFPHYSGNFWWARSDYVRDLAPPIGLRADGIDKRRGAERWIGSGSDPAMTCHHQSGINHYKEPYSEDSYRIAGRDVESASIASTAEKPPSWLVLDEGVQKHLRELQPISVIVEIGGGHGFSLFALASTVPHAKAYRIGTLNGLPHSEADWFQRLGGQEILGARSAEEWVASQLERFPNVRLVKQPSAVAAAEFEYLVDVLHIAALRTYSDIGREFSLWEPKVRPGGCVLFPNITSCSDEVGRFFRDLPGKKYRIPDGDGWRVWYKPLSPRVQRRLSCLPSTTVIDNLRLSVLIPTLPIRQASFQGLLGKLQAQITSSRLEKKVEILSFLDDRQHPVGKKRNVLMQRAVGDFVVFVDDDDEVADDYLAVICAILEQFPDIDCIGFIGELIESGGRPEPTIYSLRYAEQKNWGTEKGYRVFLRPPQHVNPIRRQIAIQYPFPEINCGEDSVRAAELARHGALRKEYFIGDRSMYRYCFSPENSQTQRPGIVTTSN